jgi:1,4-dihydroxy-2-naphthoate octaprenyltransferase
MAGNRKQPFASVMHLALVILLLVSFVLITQQQSRSLYQIGFMLLVASTFVQIVFGNVSPSANFKRSMKFLGVGLIIITAVFALGIIVTPLLVNLGR